MSVANIGENPSPVAWRLTGELDEQRQLFHNQVVTNYTVHAFVCSCNNTEIIICSEYEEVEYRCRHCENEYFLNANMAWSNFHAFSLTNNDPDFTYKYHILKKENNLGIGYSLPIPKSIDMLRNNVIYGHKDIYQITIDKSGYDTRNYETKIDASIFEKMERKLVRYIAIFNYFDIAYDKSKKLTFEKIRFFLRHKYLKFTEYYYWKEAAIFLDSEDVYFDIKQGLSRISNYREEKSVKKAVYATYLKQMDLYRSFHPGSIHTFSRSIMDPNILVKILSLDSIEYIGERWVELDFFLSFLKRFYSEKQIANLFNFDVEKDGMFIFYDTLDMFEHQMDEIKEHFHKVKCSLRALHDEFSHCLYVDKIEQASEYHFSYTQRELDKCIYTNGYKVKLPKTNVELHAWGESLHNCLSTYESKIKTRCTSTIIYGFFTGEILIFAAEIRHNKVVQSSGKYNQELNMEEKFTLYEWFGNVENNDIYRD